MKAWRRHMYFIKRWSESDTYLMHSHSVMSITWLPLDPRGAWETWSLIGQLLPSDNTLHPHLPQMLASAQQGPLSFVSLVKHTSTGLVQKRCYLYISWKNEYMNDGIVTLFFYIFKKKPHLGLLFNRHTDQLCYSNPIYNSAVASMSMLRIT